MELVINTSAQKCSITKTEQASPVPSPTLSATAHNTVMGTRAVTRDIRILHKQKKFEIELPNEDNIFEVDLIIKCLGKWEGIVHRFRAKIPSNYPFTFPLISCLESEKSFHPNIQPSDGSVCLGILTSEEWKAMYSLSDVCTALSDMFLSPNWEHSLNQEAFELFHDNKNAFHDRLRSLGASITTSETLPTPKISENADDMVKEGIKSTQCDQIDQFSAVALEKGEINHIKVKADQCGGKEENINESTLSTVCVKAMTDICINEEEIFIEGDNSHIQSTHSKVPVPPGNAQNILAAESMKIVSNSTEIVQNSKLSGNETTSSKSETSVAQDLEELSTITETIAMVCYISEIYILFATFVSCHLFLLFCCVSLYLLCPQFQFTKHISLHLHLHSTLNLFN